MKHRHIYGPHAYSRMPIADCYWSQDVPDAALDHPPATGRIRCRTLVIGAGYTGLNAALALAEDGGDVMVLDAQFPGFGASGRNGGFCCLGGSRASDGALRRFGTKAPAQVRQAEAAAIAHVDALLNRLGIDVDRHSRGEAVMAHSPAMMKTLRAEAETLNRHGLSAQLIERADLPAHGLHGPKWHGALHVDAGFALHPRKYLAGLARAATRAGARIHGRSPVTEVRAGGRQLCVTTPTAEVEADRLIVATNGYMSETLIPWFRNRTLPAQSAVIATRPLTAPELEAQGWTAPTMAYEERRLLHYFHLTPDNRMVFGQRGGLIATAANDRRIRARVRADFDRLFPEWRGVETPFSWSGMVCLTASLTPYCGPIPGLPGAFTAFGYHGNGVAMGSYLGAMLADLTESRCPRNPLPLAFTAPPPRFPLGRARRLWLAAEYGWARLTD
ncbi:NAD(P)/FAD-dependent oxidoreductase [Pseudooceanicola aestuarii]|uniref:NAD(P)/FAD-dependent oxidoreductase n=1 Tax=Pseudooceanicola aestuarii TaxID=2697319 RepID=UPI0013D2FF09|nr:FAD-dependent oxidoreductase [Pseudooceanicola aestuarii]